MEALQDILKRLADRYEQEMIAAGLLTPDLQMGIHPPPDTVLDGISSYDGTAGFDNRPDFVRADDERVDHGA
jgi:hypothetical protein